MLPLQDTVPSRSVPIVNWALIAVNIFFFFILVSLGPRAEVWVAVLGTVPARLLHYPGVFQYSTLLTAMFLHAGWAHLFSNMLALYIFGDNVEDRLGSSRYLVFYLVCGVAAGLLHTFLNPTSRIPAIGASGAISGVMAAYVIFFPGARVITLVPLFFLPWLFEVPALFYIGFWFVSQLWNGLLTIVSGIETFGGVAWWAHVGGFVAGAVMAPLLARRQPRRRAYLDEYFPW